MTKSNISQKKLKAIVFTDIVGFTKISAEDEQHALDIIDKQRELLKPIVLEHKGEWLKEIGDGLLFSFDSSLDAVNCSIKIQQALKDVDDFKIRIGIHQGDIFVKDGDVYGDDVNIASRVEGFSPEGGITISDKVYKDIQSVKEIKTSFIGHKPLKGVNQETKVRCITSNDLPKNRFNYFPKIIAYLNFYFGICILWFVIEIFLRNVRVLELEQLEQNHILLLMGSLGLVFILIGYSTLSFFKGISITSQKLIFYLGTVFGLYCLISFNIYFFTAIDSDYIPFIIGMYLFTLFVPISIIKITQFIYNKIKLII